MRWIAAIWAHALIEAAVAEGVARAALALPGGDPEATGERLPERVHLEIWRRVMKATRDPGFPIRFGASLSTDAYELLGLACKTAANVDEALDRIVRYLHLWTNTVRIVVDRGWGKDGEHARVALVREGKRGLALRSANECAVAEILHALRTITGVEVCPLSVHFCHTAPDDVREHARFFGCPLRFSSDFDGLVLSDDCLATPLQLADGGLSRYLLAQLDERDAETRERSDLVRLLRAAVGDLLLEGRPTLARVAKQLGMSGRTLRRRLSEEGLGFSDVVADVRRAIADELLAAGRPIAEVSYLVGYSEPSAFHRAYKGWTGKTPRAASAE